MYLFHRVVVSLNELVHVTHLEQCLVNSKHSISVSFIISQKINSLLTDLQGKGTLFTVTLQGLCELYLCPFIIILEKTSLIMHTHRNWSLF